MRPPTANELVGPPPHCLDQQRTLKIFLGKTQVEAEELCRVGTETECFTYMAAAGLCYYLPSAFNYLKSDAYENDWDFALSLMCRLSSQATTLGTRGEPLVLIKRIANYCDTHREKFGFDLKGAFAGRGELFDKYLQEIRSA